MTQVIVNWQRGRACGGNLLWTALVNDLVVVNVSRSDGEWRVWSPGLCRHVGAGHRTAQEARRWVEEEMGVRQ